MPKVIGITGHAQHGKNTCAEIIAKRLPGTDVRTVALADALRKFVTLQDPIVGSWGTPPETLRYATAVEQFGYEGAKRNPEVRRLLQRTGTEAGRNVFGPDCWIDALERSIKDLPYDTVVVVPDVRFENEVRWVLRHGRLLGVKRIDAKTLQDYVAPGIDPTHASEAFIETALMSADVFLLASNTADLAGMLTTKVIEERLL